MTDVITRHGRDGAVLFVSPAAESLFGCGIAELHGHGLFDRVHVADRPAYLTALGDAAALGESRRSNSACAARRSTPTAARRRNSSGSRCAAGRSNRRRPTPASMIAAKSLRCCATSPSASGRSRRSRTRAAEAERANAAKSRFLATMSHELRTPLNAIIGFSEMLTKEAVLMLDAERRNEYAGLINDSGNHLLAVVNGILDMSKIETGNFEITPEPFAPAQVDRRLLRPSGAAGTRGGHSSSRRSRPAICRRWSPTSARSIRSCSTCLSNAIRFTDRGGKVTIGARAEAATITFAVEDNGVGISDEDLARVGEPYFQARASYDRRHGGTGLGLSIVKGLVRLHGGEVAIRSRVGEGTRVTVRLPLDCERAHLATQAFRPGFGRCDKLSARSAPE